MKRRNTIQKEEVFDAVQMLHGHVTAEEVYAAVHPLHPTLARGTVYRNLNVLSEEGKIRRIEIPGGPDRFDFHALRHPHIRCVACGRVFDADLVQEPPLEALVRDAHGFRLLDYEILLKGVCPDCRKATNEKEE